MDQGKNADHTMAATQWNKLKLEKVQAVRMLMVVLVDVRWLKESILWLNEYLWIFKWLVCTSWSEMCGWGG